MDEKTKKILMGVLNSLESAKCSHEVMTEDPPWKGNSVMEGCVRGFWSDTPKKVDKSIKELKSLLYDK